MTHEGMEALIDSVNDGSAEDRVFLWNLGDGVAKAKVWLPGENCVDFEDNGWVFFFVYIGSECVAAVHDMGRNNFQAYVKKEMQNCGLMTKVMADVILPYLRSQGRTLQRTQYETEQSRRFLKKLGFIFPEPEIAQIELSKFGVREFPAPAIRILTQRQGELIRMRMSDMWNYIVHARRLIICTLKDEYRRRGLNALANIRANIRYTCREQIRDADVLEDIGYSFGDNGRLVRNCLVSTGARDIADAGGEDAEAMAERIKNILLLAYTCIAKTEDQLYNVYGVDYIQTEMKMDAGSYRILEEIREELSSAGDAVDDYIRDRLRRPGGA
jgi:hypothetical protein